MIDYGRLSVFLSVEIPKIFPKAHGNQTISWEDIAFTYIVAHYSYGGNYAKTSANLYEMGWFPYLMNKTTFSKRLKELAPHLESLFNRVIKKLMAVNNEFAVDSFPIEVAHKTRWARSTLAPSAEIGYCASKREYLLGFKASAIADSTTRVVVDCWIVPANVHDKRALEAHTVNLPENSILYADKAYNDKKMEAQFNDNGICLAAIRRSNMKNEDNTPKIQQHKQKKENSLRLSLA